MEVFSVGETVYSLCDRAASSALYDADEQHGPKQHRKAGANTLQPNHVMILTWRTILLHTTQLHGTLDESETISHKFPSATVASISLILAKEALA